MLRIISYNYQSVDIDLGDMFHNFPLHPPLQLYSGVDLSPFIPELLLEFLDLNDHIQNDNLAGIFTRDWMGFKPSPEWACRFYYLAEEFIRGNELDEDSPFFWDQVVLNVLGHPRFNPSLPNVMKINSKTNRIVGDLRAYVDDLRVVRYSLEHAWSIARRIAPMIQYLGIQDAPRKRRIDNGPWAGSIFLTSDNRVQKL